MFIRLINLPTQNSLFMSIYVCYYNNIQVLSIKASIEIKSDKQYKKLLRELKWFRVWKKYLLGNKSKAAPPDMV